MTFAQVDARLIGFLRSELPHFIYFFFFLNSVLGLSSIGEENITDLSQKQQVWANTSLATVRATIQPLITPPRSRLLLQITVSPCANRNHIAKISSHTVFFNNFKYHIVSFRGVCQRCYPTGFVVNSRSPPGQICQAWKELRSHRMNVAQSAEPEVFAVLRTDVRAASPPEK